MGMTVTRMVPAVRSVGFASLQPVSLCSADRRYICRKPGEPEFRASGTEMARRQTSVPPGLWRPSYPRHTPAMRVIPPARGVLWSAAA